MDTFDDARNNLTGNGPDEQAAEFEVTHISAELGEFTVSLPSLANCMWHGPYFEGKLSIYSGTITGTPLIPLQAIVFVILNEKHPELEGVGYHVYDINDSPLKCVESTLDVIDVVIGQLNQLNKDVGVHNGTITTH